MHAHAEHTFKLAPLKWGFGLSAQEDLERL